MDSPRGSSAYVCVRIRLSFHHNNGLGVTMCHRCWNQVMRMKEIIYRYLQ